jgi:hydrogenase 3 maturation protease
LRVLRSDVELTGEISRRVEGKRTVFCGVGNDLRGDDGVGLRVARDLSVQGLDVGVSVIICGELPENYLQDIVDLDPECVVFLDAANVGEPPGTIMIIESREIDGHTISTHRLPLSFLSRIIESRLNHVVDTFILGIQIGSCGFGEEMTEEAAGSSERLSSVLSHILSS